MRPFLVLAALGLVAGLGLSACASAPGDRPATPRVAAASAPRPTTVELALPAEKALERMIALLAAHNIPVASTLRDARLVTTTRIFVANRGAGGPLRCAFSDDRTDVPHECLDLSVQYQFFVQAKDAETTRLVTRLTVVGLDSIGLPRGEIGDPDVIDRAMARLDPVIAALRRP